MSGPLAMSTFDGVSAQLTTTNTVVGAWTVEVSNDYQQGSGNIKAVDAAAATWTNITSLFLTTVSEFRITASLSVGASPSSLGLHASKFMFRAIRFTFTPASGAGNVRCIAFAKGNY